jgi:serine/threonine protein kinase
MSLPAGTRLGPYEILAPLGAGGMGEVYRARDGKLNREVAIKVLPELFAADAERLARFQREAHVLASLNHPHIAAIYGFEESGSVRALVLELVEGETLAEKIGSGPIPIDEALAIARQVADALEAAHEKGIVHRDLKPANVKLTPEGKVKVLDFGLAKALTKDTSAPEVSHSPTLTAAATQAGVVIGTAAYMSPEQARGRSVDKRTDVWAFGGVLYEMLTGRKAFEGETVSDTLAAILKPEPNWTALPASTPVSVRRLLKRCLERDPKRRLHDIADARLEIDTLSEEPPAAPPETGSLGLRGARPWALEPASGALRPLTETPSLDINPFFSPDGRFITFQSDRSGRLEVWVMGADGSEPRRLTSTGTAGHFLLWTKDSRALLYRTPGSKSQTMRAGLDGGDPQPTAEVAGGAHMSFSPDHVRIMDVVAHKELWVSPLSGGTPEKVFEFDDADARIDYPVWSPDGNWILFDRFRPQGGDIWMMEGFE